MEYIFTIQADSSIDLLHMRRRLNNYASSQSARYSISAIEEAAGDDNFLTLEELENFAFNSNVFDGGQNKWLQNVVLDAASPYRDLSFGDGVNKEPIDTGLEKIESRISRYNTEKILSRVAGGDLELSKEELKSFAIQDKQTNLKLEGHEWLKRWALQSIGEAELTTQGTLFGNEVSIISSSIVGGATLYEARISGFKSTIHEWLEEDYGSVEEGLNQLETLDMSKVRQEYINELPQTLYSSRIIPGQDHLYFDSNFNEYNFRLEADGTYSLLMANTDGDETFKVLRLSSGEVLLPINFNPTGNHTQPNWSANGLIDMKRGGEDSLIGIAGSPFFRSDIVHGIAKYWVSAELSPSGSEETYDDPYQHDFEDRNINYGFYIDDQNRVRYLEANNLNSPNWDQEIKTNARAYFLGLYDPALKEEGDREARRLLYAFDNNGFLLGVIRTPNIQREEEIGYAKRVFPSANRILGADGDFLARIATFDNRTDTSLTNESDGLTGLRTPIGIGIFSSDSPPVETIFDNSDVEILENNLGNGTLSEIGDKIGDGFQILEQRLNKNNS